MSDSERDYPESDASAPNFHVPDLDQIDLGDDLVEKTAVITPPPLVKGRAQSGPENAFQEGRVEFVVPAAESIDELLGSVRILIGEGLTEDAKKILHYVLIRDPGNLVAKKNLNQLRDLELKHIMEDSPDQIAFSHRESREASEAEEDSESDVESLIQQLDADLNLGLFDEGIQVRAGELSLFQDTKAMNEYCSTLESQLGSASQDWMDMGIAFLEMEIYPVAIRLFNGALRRVEPSATLDRIVPLTLLSLALVLKNRPYDAISTMQPVLRDADIPKERKVELFYLMGRTYEMLRKYDLALHYYGEVAEIDPKYRDVERRAVKRAR